MSEPQIYEQILHKIQVHGVEEENTTVLDLINELELEKRINQEDLKLIHKLEERMGKAIEYIKMNCIKSDEWEDLGFCNFVPTGNIKYKPLSAKKVEHIINLLEGKSDE